MQVGAIEDPSLSKGHRGQSRISLAREIAESLTANARWSKEWFEHLHGLFPPLDRVEGVVRR